MSVVLLLLYVELFTEQVPGNSRTHNESITDGTKVPEAAKTLENTGHLPVLPECAPAKRLRLGSTPCNRTPLSCIRVR